MNNDSQPSTFNSQPAVRLEHSRVLVLCVSANAFSSDWAQIRLTLPQLSTLNHQPACDPLNKERRFIPLRLDDVPIKGSLAQFLYINWLPQKPNRSATEN